MKKILSFTLLLAIVVGLTSTLTSIPVADAACTLDSGLTGAKECFTGVTDLNQGTDAAGIVKSITNILLFLVGALSVVVIIVAGLRMVVQGGDSSAVGTARTQILYALVGIFVAVSAYALVNFIITAVTK